MSDEDHPEPARWLMSALADGEADGAERERALRAWAAGERGACDGWHAYHLIGDVLRSDELASPPARDEAFLARLRQRLADEAPVCSPAPVTGAGPVAMQRAPRARWHWSVAAAAGLGALATVLLVQRSDPAGGDASRLLAAAPAPVVAQASAVTAPGTTALLVRDAQLDRYLRAHREYGVAQPVSLPGAARHGGIEPVAFER